MDRCTAPGCTGLVEDGYCNVCGLAPPATANAATANAAAAPATPAGPGTPTPDAAQAARPDPEPEPSGSVTLGSTALSGRTPSGRTISARSRSTAASRRGALGLGLVEVPPVPTKDPATAVLDDPVVPERQRFCSNCGEPVGRGHDGAPGRTKGFCRKCGHGFDFRPKLQPGELVGGQYEVLGCLAHGGLGWIYLARDRNVSDRWVVLKGLLDSGDREALAAAAAERAFLAEVEHPNIVRIYNFVQHLTGGEPTGYIVMEYVGGRSLRDLVLDLRKTDKQAALPLRQVIAYLLEVLRALGYLHGRGLLFCDFKPDNAIHSEEQLKLIDLGGVRRVDDVDSAIYGTVGYQAPEIASEGPSIASDLYTVGRALAVLAFRFEGYTSRYVDSLPPTAEIPLLQRYDSLDRWLRRATHQDPAARFADAGEMAEQLTGVLREILADEDGTPRPAPSPLFGPELEPVGTDVPEHADGGPALGRLDPREAALALPAPVVDPTDPAAGLLAGLAGGEPEQVMGTLTSTPIVSVEVTLMIARVGLRLGDPASANALLDELWSDPKADWRVDWCRGLTDLAAGRCHEARQAFFDMYAAFPGELATKLALAYAFEGTGDLATAGQLYRTVWRTDVSYVSAAFGLARAQVAAGRPADAVAVLDSVPKLSSRYVAAQLAAMVATMRGRLAGDLDPEALQDAGRRLEALDLGTERRGRFAAELLGTALAFVTARGDVPSGPAVLGTRLTRRDLRRALDRTYRVLAHVADEPRQRHELVDRANAVRPRTWV